MAGALLGLADYREANAEELPITVETRRVVWLERFTQYVRWPEAHRVSDKSQAFVLCVANDPGFFALVDALLSSRLILGKNVHALSLSQPDPLQACDLTFLGHTPAAELEPWLQDARQRQTLLIAAAPGFAQLGVHINLYEEQNLQKFELNLAEAQRAGLTIDARLLQMGRPVTSGVSP